MSILTRKIRVTGEVQGLAGICTQLTLAESTVSPPNNATAVFNGNNAVITNTAGGTADYSSADEVNIFSFKDAGSSPIVAEMTTNSISLADSGSSTSLLIADTSLSNYVQGVVVSFGTGSSDGTIFDGSFTPIFSGLNQSDFTFPYKAHIEVFEDGTGTFKDSDGRSSALAIAIGPALTNNLVFVGLASPPIVASETIDFTINGGSTPFLLPLDDSSAKTWCNLPPYPLFEESFYISTLEAPAVLSNGDRTVSFTHDNVNTPEFIAGMGYAEGTQPVTIVQNTFELVVNANTDDAINGSLVISSGDLNGTVKEQFIEVGLIPSFNNYNINIGGVNVSTIPALSPGDIFSATIIDGSPQPSIRFSYKIGSDDPVFLDPIELVGGTDFGSQAGFLVTPQASGMFQATYDGLESNMVIDTYPTGYTDSFGDAMPSKTAAETKLLQFEESPFFTNSNGTGTVVLSGGNRTMTSTADGSNILTANGYSSRFLSVGSGIRVIEMTIDTQIDTTLGGFGDELLDFRALKEDVHGNSLIHLSKFSDDALKIRSQGASGTIFSVVKASYVPADGDVWAIEADTDNDLVRAHLWDGSTLYTSGWIAHEFEVAYVPIAGFLTMPTSTTSVITQNFNAADLDGNITYSVGAMDLLGVVIT